MNIFQEKLKIWFPHGYAAHKYIIYDGNYTYKLHRLA